MRLDVWVGVLAVLLVAGCATSGNGPAERERRAARLEWERQGTHYRSSEGFQDARWGMTLAEVHSVFPDAKVLNGSAMRWKTTIAKMPAVVTLGFLEGRFVAVDVFFPETGNVRDTHLLIRRLLNRKYGPPRRDRDTADEAQRRVGSYRSAADAAYFIGAFSSALTGVPQDLFGQNRMDVRAENDEAEARRLARDAEKRFLLLSRWETVESQVKLKSVSTSGLEAAVIEYESARYAPEIAKARKKAAELELQRMTKEL